MLYNFYRLLRKKKITGLGLILAAILILVFMKTSKKHVQLDYEIAQRLLEGNLSLLVEQQKGKSCVLPDLDPFSVDAMTFFEKVPKLDCKRFDWVECQFSECQVKKEFLANATNVICEYRDIIHVSDHEHLLGNMVIVRGDDKYTLKDSDQVNIRCSANNEEGTIFALKTWTGNKAGIRKVHPRRPPPGRENRYSVMILGFQAVSHYNFIRQMPETFRYLNETMGATILNKYNIVGDEPEHPDGRILCGTDFVASTKKPIENPASEDEIKHENSEDEKAFIFFQAKKMGYRTSYLEDRQDRDADQRHSTFNRRPADHYLRPFYLEESMHGWKSWINGRSSYFCSGDSPSYKMLLNLTRQFLELNGTCFGLTYISDITHDNINMIQISDKDVKEYLQFVQNSRHREDTVFIILADHGFRYGSFRLTFQGLIEERLPFVAILLPKKMAVDRPDAVHALKENQEVLTTPYDLHTTLLDILDLHHLRNLYTIPGSGLPRGMSLLRAIPKNRSCAEAGILPEWCACGISRNSTDDILARKGPH